MLIALAAAVVLAGATVGRRASRSRSSRRFQGPPISSRCTAPAPTSPDTGRCASSTSRTCRRRASWAATPSRKKSGAFEVVEPLIYVAADFYGFGILDISNPAAPKLRGSLKTAGAGEERRARRYQGRRRRPHVRRRLHRQSNAAKPAMLGSFFLRRLRARCGGVGSIAYAVDAPTGIYMFDLTKPGAPEPVHAQQSASAPGDDRVSDPKAATPKLAVLVGGGTLQVYDLTERGSARPDGSAEDPERPSLRGPRCTARALSRRFQRRPAGCRAVRSRRPLRSVGGFKTAEPARDVAVNDSFVFLVVGAAVRDTPRIQGSGSADTETSLLKRVIRNLEYGMRSLAPAFASAFQIPNS